MTRQTNDSVPDLLLRHNWPLDKEFILITGGFGEVWIFAQLVADIMKSPHRAFILSESAARIFSLFVDIDLLLQRSAILKDENQIAQFEAFIVRYSPTYTQQYFAGKRFVADIRCSSIVHYPYLCRAVQADMLSYHDALKVVFDLDIRVAPQFPDTSSTDALAEGVLGKALATPSTKPICLLFVVNVTHEGLDFSSISQLVELIENELGMNVLINVTLKANANGHGLDEARGLVQQLRQSKLSAKCIEIEGHLLASISKLISLAIGPNGGGMDVVRYFGTADLIYLHTPHRWEAGAENNKLRNVSEKDDTEAGEEKGRIVRHKDFTSGSRGVFCYTPQGGAKIQSTDLSGLVGQYRDFANEHR